MALVEEAAAEQATLDLYESPEQATAALDPGMHEAEWLPNYRNYHRATFGAFSSKGELVGCISLYEREDDHVGVLETLFVRKAERCRGHARRLVRAAVDDAKDRGIGAIDVFTIKADQQALGAWQHLLKRPPNAQSKTTFRDFPTKVAIGWQLRIDEIDV